jgi:hypothetical protein
VREAAEDPPGGIIRRRSGKTLLLQWSDIGPRMTALAIGGSNAVSIEKY